MVQSNEAGDVYRAIGATPAISAAGTPTPYGGTKLRQEAIDAMSKAATVMVEMDDLNIQAGKVIAELTGAEAGFVTSGSAGGLVLQAAACIAGSDPAKMEQLPDTTGLKDEIVIQNSHRFPYDQSYRVGGAKLVGVGTGRMCEPWQMDAAITEKTAAVAYLRAGFVSRRALPLEEVCEIAHARGVPVIVDGASTLPPRENLRKYTQQGADMVIYSGGKGVRGPQGTGILCGRADLIEAAMANAAPHRFMGRGMKVAKEEIIGLLTALQIFVEEDEEAENRRYTEMSQSVLDALVEIPGLGVTVEHDEYDYLVPMAVLELGKDWNGPSPAELQEALKAGDPPIYLGAHGNPDKLEVNPTNLDDQELETVIRRLREELLG